MKRCFWCNEKNHLYVKYHDEEWGRPRFDDEYLFEMLLLESFQAGLSWECVLNKREYFRKAFDGFDYNKIAKYDDKKFDELYQNNAIIRNKLKIKSVIKNAQIFIDLIKENGSFIAYLKRFWDGQIIFENNCTMSELSDKISKDLQKRGMRFVGSTIIYSYLQAIGIVNAHDDGCFLNQKKYDFEA